MGLGAEEKAEKKLAGESPGELGYPPPSLCSVRRKKT